MPKILAFPAHWHICQHMTSAGVLSELNNNEMYGGDNFHI
jgi:hypothetical protein